VETVFVSLAPQQLLRNRVQQNPIVQSSTWSVQPLAFNYQQLEKEKETEAHL
jgi:hypothetical protein